MPPRGQKMSKESREKMRRAHLGVSLSREHAKAIGAANTIPLQNRFWNRVKKIKGGCWLWLGAKDARGYGRVGADQAEGGGTRLSHRVAYELTHGKIESSLFVCHSCDNPSCCNPKHLFVGTALDNNRDMY